MSPDGAKPAASMGRVEKALVAFFTKAATVTEVERVDDAFTLVTLAGEALRGVSWVPGQKVQIPLGGFTSRTFTPISWNAEEGSTRLLVFDHGEGPVHAWLRALAVNAACSLFGPRGSLDLTALERPALLFGDETSFGLAHAVRFTPRGSAGVEFLFEVASRAQAERALDAVRISGAHLVERNGNDAHQGALADAAERLVREHSLSGAVLSGAAPSIQTLGKRLRSLGIPRASLLTKAYWAPGKTGLD